MGFLSGGVTALRFKVSGARPHIFDQEHIERLAEHAIGRAKIANADGVEAGWAAGGHILDTAFGLEKNIVNDALHFELRIDTNNKPADLFKAYYQGELEQLAKDNPSGFASARQKREAKSAALSRIEQEAKDGRFIKRKCIPVLWDRTTNEVLFGATSLTQVDRFTALFEQTFSSSLTEPNSRTDGLLCITADSRAAFCMGQLGLYAWRNRTISPAEFTPGGGQNIAWIADSNCCDYLGNEFLLWLWFYSDTEGDTVKAEDGSDITFMLSQSLVMECPRGQHGADSFRSLGPSRMPEARRAAQAGKLPRKVGLTMVRHNTQYELTIHAETLAIGAAKLPADEGSENARAKLEQRITDTRELLVTLDLLYGVFVRLRLSSRWASTLKRMQRWLGGEDLYDATEPTDGFADALREAAAESFKGMGVTVEIKPGAAA